ncbi:hypothetical protein [Pedobacter agri]|uniref:hypothetical protein n=1 Tax=Pedobacter agri TaxID=454586 RepID=UPI00292CF49D|nr:hypothetical protein [Pedobacter agri]
MSCEKHSIIFLGSTLLLFSPGKLEGAGGEGVGFVGVELPPPPPPPPELSPP